MVEQIKKPEQTVTNPRVVKVTPQMMIKAMRSKQITGLVPATLSLGPDGQPIVRQALSQLNQ